ncbi:hypothetical protein ACFY30_37710 [Streptomyces sp. NPDC000345]|uniref:hypothetical protein n=1 Tax=Streptomyces sp. NPDC000345 TaxID=3364537 RepID=UPI00367F2702
MPLAEVGEWLHPFERYWRERMRTPAAVLDEQEQARTPAAHEPDQNPSEDPER